jgi:GT2 family glycosyltransferase
LQPKISVIIPTYNRTKKLNTLLSSIVEFSSRIDLEIIIVDDSPKPSLIEPIIKSKLNGKLVFIHNKNRGFISRAKNLGLRKAQGEYIFFVDDDNVLSNQTISELVAKFDEDKRIGALMPIVYYKNKPALVWVYSAPLKPGKWKFDLVGRNNLERSKPSQELIETDALPNASMIRKKILDQIGRLDETLPVNSSCDLCQKIKHAGYGTYALTTAPIYHDVELPDTPGYWAQHASEDSQRRYYEVRDWFDLMARLHKNENLLVLKEFARSMSFFFVVGGGILLLSRRRKQSLLSIYLTMLRGLRDGVMSVNSARNKVDW